MLYGLYIGTVIANDDPERAGRVKVRIEGITTPTATTSIAYKYPAGDNIAGGLTPDEIDTSRISTVWANVAGPIKGESSIGKYNRTRNIASAADFSTPDGMTGTGSTGLDEEGRQTPPSSQFSRISDAFAYAPSITVQKTNTYSYSYMSQGYPNAAKGTYGILNIGAKVYVQFINGSYRDPVVIGILNTKTGYSQLYNMEANAPSYPGTFENVAAQKIDDGCGPPTAENAQSLISKARSYYSRLLTSVRNGGKGAPEDAEIEAIADCAEKIQDEVKNKTGIDTLYEIAKISAETANKVADIIESK